MCGDSWQRRACFSWPGRGERSAAHLENTSLGSGSETSGHPQGLQGQARASPEGQADMRSPWLSVSRWGWVTSPPARLATPRSGV